jgi:hypothetical protein
MKYLLLGLAVAAGFYSLHRLALWAERRGWIYYRNKQGNSGTLSNAVLEVHSLFEPSKRHVLEERRRDPQEERDSGAPGPRERDDAVHRPVGPPRGSR